MDNRKTIEDLEIEQNRILAENIIKYNKWQSKEPECPYCGKPLDEALDIANEIEMDLRKDGYDGDDFHVEEVIICKYCDKEVSVKVFSEITIEFDTQYQVIPIDENDESLVNKDNFVDSKDQGVLF